MFGIFLLISVNDFEKKKYEFDDFLKPLERSSIAVLVLTVSSMIFATKWNLESDLFEYTETLCATCT